MTKHIINQVKNEINRAIKKNQRDIEMALLKPLSPDYQFSTNGIYFLIGRPGAGKSNLIWSHIMITEKLFKKPYYSKIIFCSTSGKADKTAEVFHKSIKTPIDCVNENELINFLIMDKIEFFSIDTFSIIIIQTSNRKLLFEYSQVHLAQHQTIIHNFHMGEFELIKT